MEPHAEKNTVSPEPRNEDVREPQPVVVKPDPETILLSWHAPSRIFKPRNREFWTTIFTMGGIIGLLLFFVEGWMPVAVIISFIFFIYVLSTVPPDHVEYKISNKGVIFGDRTYFWNKIVGYWFEEKWGQKVLHVDIYMLPGRISMLLGDANEEELKEILKQYSVEQKPKDTFVDKSVKWIGKKVPLE
jgi:hypothetical protein